jgi:hypothetical protein
LRNSEFRWFRYAKPMRTLLQIVRRKPGRVRDEESVDESIEKRPRDGFLTVKVDVKFNVEWGLFAIAWIIIALKGGDLPIKPW